jgi:hypothetical protein
MARRGDVAPVDTHTALLDILRGDVGVGAGATRASSAASSLSGTPGAPLRLLCSRALSDVGGGLRGNEPVCSSCVGLSASTDAARGRCDGAVGSGFARATTDSRTGAAADVVAAPRRGDTGADALLSVGA